MNSQLIAMLQDTLGILARGSYPYQGKTVPLKLSRAQMEAVEVYLPQDVRNIRLPEEPAPVPEAGRCEYGCGNTDSFTLARQRIAQLSPGPRGEAAKPVLVLNLANPVHPGGGVRNGARAQEEDLCRKSSLLLSLESRQAKKYYDYNRSLHTYMGSDAVMIHPWVEIIKDEKGDPLPDTAVAAVMTCAAPMLCYGMEGLSQDRYEAMMYGRITGMLKVAAARGYRDLVLGAFGCGVFGNDARVVSDLFYRAFCDGGLGSQFHRVDFAVLCRSGNQYNYDEFARNFSDFYREA